MNNIYYSIVLAHQHNHRYFKMGIKKINRKYKAVLKTKKKS